MGNKKKWVAVLSGLLVICVLVAGVWIVDFDLRGRKALREGDYRTAIEKLESGLISRGKYRTALILVGDEYAANGEYEKAFGYYVMLDDDTLYIESVMALAEKCTHDGVHQTAVYYYKKAVARAEVSLNNDQYRELCDKIGMTLLDSEAYEESLPFFEMAGVSQFRYENVLWQIADKSMERNQFADALAYYEMLGMKNTEEYAYVLGLEKIYEAAESVEKNMSSLNQAAEAFASAGNTEYAAVYYSVVQQILENNYADALRSICTDEFPGEQGTWVKILRNISNTNTGENVELDERLELEAALRRVDQDAGKTIQYDRYELSVKISDSFGEVPSATGSFGDIKNLMKLCGGKSQKKVLVVTVNQGKCMIDLELTRMLPYEWQPSCAEEVEYLMVISYTREKVGSYRTMDKFFGTGGVSAFQESGQVQLYSARINNQVKNWGVIKGPEPPRSIDGDSDVTFVLGGKPYMRNYIYEALEELEKRIG